MPNPNTPPVHSSASPAPGENPAPDKKPPPKKGVLVAIIALGVVLIVLGVGGVMLRMHARHTLTEDTGHSAIRNVATFTPQVAPADQALSLPGTVMSWQDAQIYARTTGYVRKWYVDIGSKVTKGQRLADLDTPDVDNQLIQGKAQMRSDQANEALAKITADRNEILVKKGLIAVEMGDQLVAAANAAIATVQADQANVARLQNMEEFKYISAPFDGVITQRNLNVGALVDAGSTGANLFVIADTTRLRVFVDVPESYAGSVQIGMPATVTLSSYGTKPFIGTVARTGDALDPNTRTLRTEIDLDNAGQVLVPGVYATVKLALTTATHNFILPANALLFRSEGLSIALVDAQQRIHLQPVTLGRDFGNTVEVTSGVEPGMRIVLNPADSLYGGEQVSVTSQAK
jgi:RND family efflux transporter MFP subunit